MQIEVHPDNPNPKKITEVVACLRNGGTIIYPTDTVYSFGCSLEQPKAMEKIARLKNTKIEKANFSLICYDLSHISEYCMPIQNGVFKLMKQLLPGPYTFILNANSNVPKLFKSKKKTVGIRVPDNNISRAIVKELGHPMISTSIHDEDEVLEYTTDPELLHEKYKKQIDIMVNGGFGKNQGSTVLDCTGEQPEILRQGIGVIE